MRTATKALRIPGPRALRFAASALAAILFATLGAATPALAAPGGHGHHGSGGATVTPATGSDVSWPQCGGTYPKAPAFGIAGLNGGLPNDQNPCFGPSSSYPSYAQSELYWAVAAATGDRAPTGPQPPTASIYVNTADPGDVYSHAPVADWPTSGTAPAPYGTCTDVTYRVRGTTRTIGADSPACAWVYGNEKATQDLTWLRQAASAIDAQAGTPAVPVTPSAYPWWLDVEVGNTWQSGSSGVAMNVADLQGVVVALEAAGASVGVYSTSSQWAQIAGTTTTATQGLYGLADWIPGASSLSGATANCGLASFTGGPVELTQWTATYDEDHVCV